MVGNIQKTSDDLKIQASLRESDTGYMYEKRNSTLSSAMTDEMLDIELTMTEGQAEITFSYPSKLRDPIEVHISAESL